MMAGLLVLFMLFTVPDTNVRPVYGAEDEDEDVSFDDASDIFSLDARQPKEMASLPGSVYDNTGMTPFLLVEQNELYFLNTRDSSKKIDIFDTANLSGYRTGLEKTNEAVLDRSINAASTKHYTLSAGSDAFTDLDYAQGVAFDPTGSGRKDHIAIVGLVTYSKKEKKKTIYSYATRIVVQNVKTGATCRMDLDTANWMGDKLETYTAGGYFSITAGDYDHDGKETVMVYASADTAFNIYEVTLNASKNSLSKKAVLDVRSRTKQQDYSGSNVAAYKKPVVSLATGDFDGDGSDELAYMAGFYKTSNKEKGFSGNISGLEYYSAHVAVIDQTKGKWSVGEPMWMYAQGTNAGSNKFNFRILHGGAITAGDLDNDGNDEILAVGYTSEKATATYSGGRIVSATDLELIDKNNYAYSIIRYNPSSKKYWNSAPDLISANEFCKAHFTNKDSVFQPIALACAKVNGASSAEYVFVCGCIYSFENGSPMVLFQGDMLRGLNSILGGLSKTKRKDSSVNWVQNVTAGNFDGNDAGREQFAFVALEKHSGKDMYSANLGVIAGIDYSDVYKNSQLVSYGVTRKFASSFHIEDAYYHNRHFTGSDANATQIWADASHSVKENGKQLVCVPLAVDIDDDGVLARQGKRGYVYTDPEVLAVLEAGPYYGELDEIEGYLDPCETTYSIETSIGYSTSSGNNVSFGCGFAGEAGGPGFKTSLEMGYSMDWSSSIENAVEESFSTEFSALQSDIVVVSRIPEVVYCYDVFRSGRWVENGYTVRVPLAPSYFLLTIDDYNDFVDQFNARVPGNTLSKITDADLPADHIGNPFAYWSDWTQAGQGAANLSNATYTVTATGGSTGSSWNKAASKTESQEIAHGFNYSLTMQGGAEFAVGEAWAGGYVNLDYSKSSGSSTTHTSANGAGGKIQNPDNNLLRNAGIPDKTMKAYQFTWQFGKWTRDLQKGKATVPFYGYIVTNPTAASLPVTDLDAEFVSEEGKMVIQLNWSDPGDAYRPTDYFVIYFYDEKGNKTKIAKVDGDVNEYIYDGVDGSSVYKFTIFSRSKNSPVASIESEPAVLKVDSKAIYNIELSKQDGLKDIYTIYYTDGSVTEFVVTNGEKGEKGDKGDKGDKGEPGSSGSNGLSAYEIAVRNGVCSPNTTEAQWISSLGGGGITIEPVSADENGYVVGFEFVFPNGYKLHFSNDGLLYIDANNQIIFQMRPEVFPDPSRNQNP